MPIFSCPRCGSTKPASGARRGCPVCQERGGGSWAPGEWTVTSPPRALPAPAARSFIVVCISSEAEGGSGGYELATRTVFDTRAGAEGYAAGVAPSRLPLVVEGDFSGLRLDANLRFPQRSTT